MSERETRAHPHVESPEPAGTGGSEAPRLRYRPRPCGTCPWRRDVHDRWAYNNLDEYAEGTIGQVGADAPLGAPMFACHKSRTEPGELCAGWLVVIGLNHVTVRLAVAIAALPPTVLEPGPDWPELVASYQELTGIQAGGPAEPAVCHQAASVEVTSGRTADQAEDG